MNFKALLAGASMALVAGVAAHAATYPGYGLDTAGPALIIQLTPSGANIVAGPSAGTPYDGVEDTYIGVENNTGAPVGSLTLSGSFIFDLDGDGLATYGAPTPYDPYGYGGPLGVFNIVDENNGKITFVGGLANGASTYFSLEEPLDTTSFTVTHISGAPEPATWGMMLMGLLGLGGLLRSRKSSVATA